ncbi:hypothetical protein M422DRAFT_256580 [Sphaerobolus stellatus SS14]|uniref:Uncharacterized protein n=1 Tax=Sphaerobolus stellatus (strain SS14) TaxID=990650 RepID=A0A0C9UBV4_SPHS4|nr:hypothetical protein M422DRAFT_256580 [Sphaerobolus stellatus SS14]
MSDPAAALQVTASQVVCNVTFSDLTLPLVSLVVFDTFMFGLTFGRAIYLKRYYFQSSTRLMDIILRDGGLYFIALLMVNSVGLFLIKAPCLNVAIPALIPGNMHLAGALTSILVSRIFLNLRLVAYHSERHPGKPDDITCSLGVSRIPDSTLASFERDRRDVHWLLSDLSSFAEFHVSLPGFDTSLHEEDFENLEDEHYSTILSIQRYRISLRDYNEPRSTVSNDP